MLETDRSLVWMAFVSSVHDTWLTELNDYASYTDVLD